jgi:hypothetical protein
MTVLIKVGGKNGRRGSRKKQIQYKQDVLFLR